MSDSTNVQTAHDLAQHQSESYVARIVRSVTGPMPIVGGPSLGAREGKAGPRVVPDDKELLDRTAHVRTKNEPMLSFYARVGLGPTQILAMSKAEISHFVETVSQHENVQAPQAGAFGRPAPQRFLLEV